MPVYDKYAPYVFAAYGVAALVLGALVLWSMWRVVSARKKLEAAERAEASDSAGESAQ